MYLRRLGLDSATSEDRGGDYEAHWGPAANLMSGASAGTIAYALTRGNAADFGISKPDQSGSDFGFHTLGCVCVGCAGITTAKDASTLQAPNTNLGNTSGAIAMPSNDIAVDGTLPPGGFDVYEIEVVAGQTYMISLFGSGPTPLPDTFLTLYDDLGNFFNFDDDGGAGVNSLLTFTATTTGTWFIGVEAFGAAQTGGYTLDAVVQPATDEVGDTFAGAPAIDMDGVTYGFIDSGTGTIYGPNFGEVDTFAVNVEAGRYYTIEVAGGADYLSDWFDLPPGELDTVLSLYDAEGNLIAFDDDIAFPGDISSSISFFATEDTTFYLDVYSWAPWTGGYSITTSSINPADYNILDSINWASANNVPFDDCDTAYVYFAAAGETFGELGDDGVSPLISLGWNEYEMQQVMLALEQYEHILGVNYEITTDASAATFRLITTESDLYGAYMYPQDPAFGTQQGIAAFNVLSGGWNLPGQESLEQGGFSFSTILHEFGHGHGLAHPHDNGGGSEIMLGVAGPFGSYGVYDLNQGVYTVMSYNDAWDLHPDGPSPFFIETIGNGWTGTLSALDIAALQERYGANNHYRHGNDTYILRDVQEDAYYETIWDTGGRDTIRYDGANATRIDLTAATIDYSPTGGGVLSFVDGVWGGYTIARGVVIENATGGSGADQLLGNSAANELKGNAGDDFLMGRGGGDRMDGGAGFDTASYIDAASGVKASLADGCGSSGDARNDSFKNIEALQGSRHNDNLEGDKKDNTLEGLAGDDKLDGGDGKDTLLGGAGKDTVDGGKGNDVLKGDDGNDKLYGGKDNDTLTGGAGNDVLTGDHGRDVFVFNTGDGADKITDFKRGQDTIDLQATDLTFAMLDSNGNNRLDDGDAFVTVRHGNTIIDLGGAAGGALGVDVLTVEDVTNLNGDNFLF